MSSFQSNNPNEYSDGNKDSLQIFSKTCSIMYSRISRKQYEYFQAMTVIQDDIFDSCDGLVKEQVDMMEEYADSGVVSKEYMMPVIGMVNRIIEYYLDYMSLEYDLLLSRMRYHHEMLRMVNDISPELIKTYVESIKPFGLF